MISIKNFIYRHDFNFDKNGFFRQYFFKYDKINHEYKINESTKKYSTYVVNIIISTFFITF